MLPLLVDIYKQKIKKIDAFLPYISIINESSNLIRWEHFGLLFVKQYFLRYRVCEEKQNSIFQFKLLPAKSNDKILWKLKLHVGSILEQTRFFSWKYTSASFSVSRPAFLSRIPEKKLMNRFREMLVTHARTDAWTDARTSMNS